MTALLTLVGVLSPTAPGGAAADERPAAAPAAAVTERLLERGRDTVGTAAAGDTPRVDITRSSEDWAFGTAVPATEPGSDRMPQGRLFLAERKGSGWRVALEGEEDFAGGDEVVRAARQGTAHTMCRGWVRVVHDRGYATDYYHLWSNINANGGRVNAGACLGHTGTDVTCGGAAYGRHVHFGLIQNGSYVGIAGHNLGKWVFENGAAAYQGAALHGSRRVYAGGALYNYGALGFTQGIVDANGSASVNKRSGPGTGYAIGGTAADGAISRSKIRKRATATIEGKRVVQRYGVERSPVRRCGRRRDSGA